jgi:hypothetical protein
LGELSGPVLSKQLDARIRERAELFYREVLDGSEDFDLVRIAAGGLDLFPDARKI